MPAKKLISRRRDVPGIVAEVTKESKKLFAFLRDMGPFLRSEAPGLVFSATYPWGSFAPDPFPSTGSGLRLPPQISHEKNGGLPPVTSERPHAPRIFNIPCKQYDALSSNFLTYRPKHGLFSLLDPHLEDGICSQQE